uniref:Aminopeptidase n=1 Tax=Nyssomyia neivai TaxID=330878 RepID=A0A1L8E3A0_9DIPT
MELKILSFLCLILSCSTRGTSAIPPKNSTNNDESSYRLPRTSRPIHYDLHMKIDVDEAKFYGSEKIQINVLGQTDEIAINYKDMNVDESTVSLLDEDNKSLPLLQFNYNNVTEILRLEFSQVNPGEYFLNLEFNGTIRNDKKGLYISTYFDEQSNKRNIATTFMAPNYARMAYPCYDEPEYKATYKISISHKEKYFAISNMPALTVTADTTEGWKITTFDKSLRTSSYIVTFIVCDFVANKDPHTNFTIYSQPSKIEDTNFALEYHQEALHELELYLDRKFQYPKMDIIAIDDFLMGAMENWGIVTYITDRVLVNDKTEAKKKHSITKTIAHEMAHQWFGNEVTHHYWSSVWLKEGLASLFEDTITGIIFPQWHSDDKFVHDTMLFVMQDDAGKSGVRKMFLVEVETAEEIRNIYDFVTYKKAASVMRTFEHILTPPVFKEALKKYVNDFSFNVAAPDDLSACFQWAIDQNLPDPALPPIKVVFDTWITNPGFPFITVTRDYDTSRVTITQKRFMATMDSNAIPETKYFIPLNYASPHYNSDFKDTSTIGFLDHTDESAEFPVQTGVTDWVIFNVRSTMYYRVNYDIRNWELIIEALSTDHNSIDPANRAQLIDDAFNLARYGHLSYNIPLNMMKKYFQKETYYYTVATGVRNLEMANRNIRSLKTDLFSRFILELLSPLYSQVGIEEELSDDHLRKMLRQDVTRLYCKIPQSPCIEDAYDYLVANFHKDISENTRRSIYCGAVQYKCPKDKKCEGDYPAIKMLFDKWRRLARSEASRRKYDSEIQDIIASIECMKDRSIIDDLMQIPTIGYPGLQFEKPHYNLIIQALLDIKESITTDKLAFINDNFTIIQNRSDPLTNVYQAIGRVGFTDEHLTLWEAIVQQIDMGKTLQPMKKAITGTTERIEENIVWNNKLSPEVKKWLQDTYKTGPETGAASSIQINFFLFIILCAFYVIM